MKEKKSNNDHKVAPFGSTEQTNHQPPPHERTNKQDEEEREGDELPDSQETRIDRLRNKLDPMTRAEREEFYAYHEAGHAVIEQTHDAYVFRLALQVLEDYQIGEEAFSDFVDENGVDPPDSEGFSSISMKPKLDYTTVKTATLPKYDAHDSFRIGYYCNGLTRLKMERLAIVFLAGPVAEKLLKGREMGRSITFRDQRIVKGLLDIFEGDEASRSNYYRLLYSHTKAMLERCWEGVTALAGELRKQQELSGHEVRTILYKALVLDREKALIESGFVRDYFPADFEKIHALFSDVRTSLFVSELQRKRPESGRSE